MKLKRLLLRYEPPGVGLEVERDGVLDVRHKDLWLAPYVRSERQVHLLVDKLLAEEPEILQRQKHWPVLVQLLCRLYQVTPLDSGSEPSSAEASTESLGLSVGKHVVLVGLKGQLRGYTGALGTLVKARPEKGEYEVMLKSPSKTAEVLKLKAAECIVPVTPNAGLAASSLVAIHGLQSQAELNGALCRVLKCQGETQRYEVLALETGTLYRVKRENVLPLLPCQHSYMVAAMHEKAEKAPERRSSLSSQVP